MFLLHERIRISKRSKRVGRGPGSKRGKTSCRGVKGDKSRSGYKRRVGKEGGQLPLFQKLPHKGFSNYRFAKRVKCINLKTLDSIFSDGDVINNDTLAQRGVRTRSVKGRVKVLSSGGLDKKVKIDLYAYSRKARDKLNSVGIEVRGKNKDARRS